MAYKKIEVDVSQNKLTKLNKTKNEVINEIYREFELQRTVSKKPTLFGKMVVWFSLFFYYESGMEDLILSPLAAFFLEENSTSNLWFILVLPKCESDLEKFKDQCKPNEDETKLILKQLAKALFYLS